MDSFASHIAITLGWLLGACLLAGLIADRFHFPKVTAYLLVGLIAGPSVLNWLPTEHIHAFDTTTKLAMALVLFNLGCHFPLTHIRRVLRRSLILSFGEVTATFLLVMLSLLAIGQSWGVAVVLASLALATAPATTILVLKESASQGPVTEHAKTLVALNNLAAIIVFEVVIISIRGTAEDLAAPLSTEIYLLFRDVFGSVLLGMVAGLGVSFGCGLLAASRWLVLLIASTTVVLGCCEVLDMPYMLSFLAMGVMVVNSSDISAKIVAELDRLTGLLCVIFFCIHGAELNLQAFVSAGVVGATYIAGRSVGKCLGIAVAARTIGEPPQVRQWLGPALLAQAGAAIALASIAVERNPQWGQPVQAIILGSVVFFEILGPILIRQGVLRAGEVPLAQAIYHTTATPISQLGTIWNRILLVLGRDASHRRPPTPLTVADIMRKNAAGVREDASFDDVIYSIEHSHDNTYPVIDAQGAVVGQICYSRLSSALFDRTVGTLVRAADLATTVATLLHPDEPATRAVELFRGGAEDCIPVVAREAPRVLVGIVRRSDVTNMLIRGRRRR